MILIVGLGNPGDKYKNTRHNVGFMAVETMSSRYNFTWQHKSNFNAEIAIGECEFGKVVLCKPNSFMNLSGTVVASIAAFYKIPLENIFVIHDDIDLTFCRLKYKLDGGAGGHNGLISIDKILGTKYHRVRVGIGRPLHPRHDISDYVLSNFSAAEIEAMLPRLNILADKFKLLADQEFEKFKAAVSLS